LCHDLQAVSIGDLGRHICAAHGILSKLYRFCIVLNSSHVGRASVGKISLLQQLDAARRRRRQYLAIIGPIDALW